MIRTRRPCCCGSLVAPTLLLMTVVAAGPVSGTGTPVSEFDSRPNVILIFADDLGYGDLELYGQQRIATPNLTRMAAEGMTFEQFYSGAPFCPPARSTLLTGLHTGHTTVRSQGVLPAGLATFPRFLQKAGYATGLFGKWGMGAYTVEPDGSAQATEGLPEDLGFDELLGPLTHRDAHTYTLPPYPLQAGDERIHGRLWEIANGRTVEHPDATVPYLHEAYVAGAIDFIERHQAERFFLYLPLTLPHAELYLPDDDEAWQPYLDDDGQSLFPETPWAGNATFRRPNDKPRATYAAMVSRLDRDVGRLLDTLAALDLDEQTLVLFTSDNGPHNAGGIASPAFFDSTAGLAGMKWSLYEGGIRVPAIVRWPGRVPAGSVWSEPAALWDLMPTLLDLARIASVPGLDGVSLRPLLIGAAQPPRPASAPLYWETFNSRFRGQAVRVGRWKAVRLGTFSANDPVQLFDLDSDPGETTDRAADPALCATLLNLVQLLNTARTDPGPPHSIVPLSFHCTPSDGLGIR